MRNCAILASVGSLALVALGGCGAGTPNAPPARQNPTPAPPNPPPTNPVAHLRVAANNSSPAKLRQGFLHGLGADRISSATLDRVNELKPGAWRVSNLFGSYDFVSQNQLRTRLGTRIAFNLQDLFSAQWGSPVVVGPDCVANAPSYCFASYNLLKQKWSDFVEQFMLSVDAQAAGIDDFDIFNEPGSTFKGVTQAQLFELLQIAHDTIRRHQPAAVIVAPSIERFNEAGLTDMFNFLALNDLHVDAISWHELEGTPAEVAAHVASARRLISAQFAAKPWLSPVEIYINEYGPPENHLIPGWTVGWLAAFEAAGIDVANRACWQATPFWNDCASGLNGLLLEDNVTPQPLYYVHRAWAALPLARLSVSSDTSGLVAIAAKGASSVTLLIGRYSCGKTGKWCVGAALPAFDEPQPPLDVMVDLEGLGAAASATIVVECFANLGIAGALRAPTTEPAFTMPVSGGRLTIALAGFSDGAACSVNVTLTP